MAKANLHQHGGAGVSRRQAIARVSMLTVAGVAAGLPDMAGATSPTDPRLRIHEGQYALDAHKVVTGYFAALHGRTGMEVLVVIPGGAGLDDSVRDLVRRHALAGKVAFAPDLAATPTGSAATREARLADFIAHAPRLKRHARGNGKVQLVAA